MQFLNSMQVTVRKRMAEGVQFDFNCVYSKSIDLSSSAERVTTYGGLRGNIINSWAPNQLRGVSGCDTTHQFNTNFIVELPFGKGKLLAGNSHASPRRSLAIGNSSGLARWTSGFPVDITNGATWPTTGSWVVQPSESAR